MVASFVSNAQTQPIELNVTTTQKQSNSQKANEEMEAEAAKTAAEAAQMTAAAAKTEANTTRLAAMAPASTTVIVDLEEKLTGYECIALVSCSDEYGRHRRGYTWSKNHLATGPWMVMNPYEEDKKRAKKDPMYLRTTKNENWLYYYFTSYRSGLNRLKEMTIRDSEGNILFQAESINMPTAQFVNSFLNKAW